METLNCYSLNFTKCLENDHITILMHHVFNGDKQDTTREDWVSDWLIHWLIDWLTYKPTNWFLEYVNKIGKSVIILMSVKEGKGFYPDNIIFTWMDWANTLEIDCKIVRLIDELQLTLFFQDLQLDIIHQLNNGGLTVF